MSKPTYDLFISYNSIDVKLAEALHKRLVTEGFSVWFDKARLNPGCKWHDEIEKGCEASRIILPLLTPSWRKSEWTKFETYGAEAIIPIKYEGSWHEVATPPLIRYQGTTFDYSQPQNVDWPKLYKAIRKLLSHPSPKKASRITHLRYKANPYFVGREPELNKIHETLCHNPTAALTQGTVHAIAALGGIGKTTLARQYAEKFWRLYPQILWVDARIDLVSEFAKIADLLKPNIRTTDANEKANEALRILNEGTERLLILDNAEDEESVQRWIPKAGGCHTIITSRFTAWSAVVEICLIDVLEPVQARELLLRRSNREPDDTEIDAMDRLAEKLGWLPLALEQAAAFIGEQGPDYEFQDYLHLYDEAKKELLNEGVLGSTEYPDSVITTWKATIAKVSTTARSILRFSAFLSMEPIPTEMFVKGVKTVLDGEKDFSKPDNVDKPPSDEYYIRTAIKNLANYSMISTHGNDFSVHSLVQTVERLDINNKAQQAWWIEKTIDLISGYAPENAHEPKAWSIWDQLKPHAVQLWEYTQKNSRVNVNIKLPSELGKFYFGKGMYNESIPIDKKVVEIIEKRQGADHVDLAYHLGNLGESLRATNRVIEAEQYFRRALEISRKHYGENHEEVASDMNYLALVLEGNEAEQLYRNAIEIYENVESPDQHGLAKCLLNLAQMLTDQRNYEEAEQMHRRALEIFERKLGNDHPSTATSLENFASLFINRSDYEKAKVFLRRALDIREKVLGRDHPHTVRSLGKLASLLTARAEYEEAESFFRKALNINEKMVGKDHPLTVANLNNLAVMLDQKGEYEEAESFFKRALNINEKVLGRDHPDTLAILSNFASVLDRKGDKEKAEPLLKLALEICEKKLGKDNLQTATSLGNLASFFESMENIEEAEILNRRELNIYETKLERDHLDIASSLNRLGGILYKKGDYKEAESYLFRALDIYEKTFIKDHPFTANCLNSLGALFENKGNFEEAESYCRRALDIYKKVLGWDHMFTLRSLNSLTTLLLKKGITKETEWLCRKALDISEHVLGKNHPISVVSLNNLAGLFSEKRDYKEAEPLFRRVLSINQKMHGSDHPDTVISLDNLAALLSNKGDYKEADPLHRQALDINQRIHGRYHPSTARSLNNLAGLLSKKGDYKEAEILLRQALGIRERVLGKDHPDTATSLCDLATLLSNNGNYKEAEPLHRRALDIRERVLGKDHPDIATSLNNLAGILRSRGDYEVAEPLYQRVLDIRERVIGENHPDTAFTMHELAFCLDKTDNHSKAEILYKRSLEIWEKLYGGDHVESINCILNLQICFYQQSSREFDLAELKRCTVWLKDRNDPRAKKGLIVIRALGEE